MYLKNISLITILNSPILNQIGTVFIPVRNIEKARDWYCDILGLPADGEIQFGHLFVIPMNGTGIVLDSRMYFEKVCFYIWATSSWKNDCRARTCKGNRLKVIP